MSRVRVAEAETDAGKEGVNVALAGEKVGRVGVIMVVMRVGATGSRVGRELVWASPPE